MQASYVLLMQFYKLHAASHTPRILSGDLALDTERLVDELRHGLEDIIAAMDHFATAFEAIAGMRGWYTRLCPLILNKYFTCHSR